MTSFINEHILWLQVSVKYVVLVQKLDCQNYLCEEELRVGELEALVLLEVVEELATGAEINDEAVVIRGDKGVVQLHQEWVLEALKNLPLRVDLSKLDLVLLDALFLDQLHGIELPCRALPDHIYCGEASRAQHFYEVEVAQ